MQKSQKKNKGNPVPSLDKLTLSNLIKFFSTFMDKTCIDIGDSSTEDIQVTRLKNGFMLSNEWSEDKIILQNGRETDKEEPKINWEEAFDSEDWEIEPDEQDENSLTFKILYSNKKKLTLFSDGTFKLV